MGSFRLPVPFGNDPSAFFSGIPPSAKSYLKPAFSLLSRVYATHKDELITITLDSIGAGSEPDETDIAHRLGLEVADARSLTAAISFIILIIGSPIRESPPEKILDGLTEARIVEQSDRGAVAEMLNALSPQKENVKLNLRRASLISEVLPSLSGLDYTVDVRLSFETDEPRLAVPVLILHVDTDAADQELWVQMSDKQVKKVIADLTDALKRMEAAEQWASKLT